MNEREFIEWLGIELDNILCATDDTNRFPASYDLVNRVIHIMGELPQDEISHVKTILSESHKTGIIGDFQIPYDIRDDCDWIEGILE